MFKLVPARIFAVADAWNELLSDWPYRPAWLEAPVLEYVGEQSGQHFDPRVEELFLTLIEKSRIDFCPSF